MQLLARKSFLLSVVAILATVGMECRHSHASLAGATPTALQALVSRFKLPSLPELPGRSDAPAETEHSADEIVPLDSMELRVFHNLMAATRASAVNEMEIGDAVQWIGSRFVGSPYVGGLLDAQDEEQLVISVRKFDCILFVETVLALTQGVVQDDFSVEGLQQRVEGVRYRNGSMAGYASRLHYFSDWIADNERRGSVVNVTEQLGGVELDKTLNFMSRYPRMYSRYRSNDSLHTRIVEMEAGVSDLQLSFIPKGRVAELDSLLKPGDIIATATIAPGLDVSHAGIAYEREDGSVGFMHASSTAGRVVIAPSLADYVRHRSSVTGIVVARPVVQPAPSLATVIAERLRSIGTASFTAMRALVTETESADGVRGA